MAWKRSTKSNMTQFADDDFPGRPKILFIGLAESTHTHAWIELIQNEKFNVRLFALPTRVPPDEWPVRTYVTALGHQTLDPRTRRRLHPPSRALRFLNRRRAQARGARGFDDMPALWLADVIRTWQPDVVHTMGLFPAGEFFFETRQRFRLENFGKWVLQTRGGSDLALTHLDPALKEHLAELLRGCDQLVSDNSQNFRIALDFGVREEQLSRIGTVPGTGGIDVKQLAGRWQGKTSERRTILWPKAYEAPWSKALPVYEALKLCWNRLEPCELHLLAMTDELRMYYWTLPEEIRRHCVVRDRISRAETLQGMTRARVMLAPSLVDGTPNSMFEAMAAGALPIVSPLETISAIVEHERNVLFARNLYPHEIADALVRSMTDDQLVDDTARTNLELVGRLADRETIRLRVIQFYEDLCAQSDPVRSQTA